MWRPARLPPPCSGASGRAGRTPGPLILPGELHDVRLRAHLACLSGVRPQGPRSARHRPFTARADNNAARYPPRVNRTVGSFSEKPTIVRRAGAAQACGPPRARRPAVIPGSELPGIAAAGHHREDQGLRPAPAGSGRLRYGDQGLRKPARGNAILAAAAWRCLDHLVGPSAETWCDAMVVNGRRLPAIMRPRPPPASR